MLWIIYIFPVIAVATILLFLYAFLYEPTNFRLSEVDIFIRKNQPQNSMLQGSKAQDNLSRGNFSKQNISEKTSSDKLDKPAGKPILTILHLSDFHLRRNFKGKRLFKFVRNLSSLNPDLIFITGDLLGGNDDIDYLTGMLSPLQAKLGKYAVFGVHDHYDKAVTEFIKNMFKRKRVYKKGNDISYLAQRLKDIDIEVLMNESKLLQLQPGHSGIGGIWIIGLDDPIIDKIDIDKAFSDFRSRDNDLPLWKGFNYKDIYKDVFKLKKEKIHEMNERGKLRIVLIHTPDADSIINLVKKKVDIIFCGHTHGGQIRFPLIGAIISGCKIKAKFASGLFYFKNIVLYVTRGLGEGKYSPFRFYCQPEASLVRIYKVN